MYGTRTAHVQCKSDRDRLKRKWKYLCESSIMVDLISRKLIFDLCGAFDDR